jgi:hypothetical protein
MSIPAIEILSRASWSVHRDGINHLGGIEGQVTRCRSEGVLFYVRENVALAHFRISSGERQALKAGRVARRHPQILELLAPAAVWDQLAELVHTADQLGRTVRRNRLFTWAWAERLFAEASDSLPFFGEQPMSRIIDVIVSPQGETTVQTRGYAGGDCLQASKFLERSLGIVATEQKTTEFFATPTTEQHLQQ